MNCSVLRTMPRSSRYFSLRNRCVFASVAGYQVPLRLNVHDDASRLDSKASISALAVGERVAAWPAAAKTSITRNSRSRCSDLARASNRPEGSIACRRSGAGTSSFPARCRSATPRSGPFDPLQAATVGPEPDLVRDQGAAASKRSASTWANFGLSITRPISVFSRAERWSKLNEPTKMRFRSTAKVFACKAADELDPNLTFS